MAKTNWTMSDTVLPSDMNSMGEEINDSMTVLAAATSAATASTVMQRDTSGRAKVAAPAAADDIARKDTVDALLESPSFTGVATSPAFQLGSTAISKQVGLFSTLASTSNQKIDLYFTGAFYGYFDIEITGAWNGINNNGLLRKRFALVVQPTSTISNQVSRYEEVIGGIGNTVAISDVTWDSTNSRWRIQIVIRQSSSFAEQFAVMLTAFTQGGNNSQWINNIAGMKLGTVYTTDTTSFPLATVQIKAPTTVMSEMTMSTQLRMASIADTASQWSRAIYFDATNSSGTKTTNNYLQADSSNDLRYAKAGGTPNLVWTAGNDGSGSGLDADKLDGYDVGTTASTVANTIPVRDSTGEIMAQSYSTLNPDNVAASARLSWQGNTPRIRIGGSGTGTTSGFEIQGLSDAKLFRVDNVGQVTNYAPSGTAPFVVTSSAKNVNFQADTVDGLHDTDIMTITGQSSTPVDLNTIVKAGSYRLGNNHTNAPSGYAYGNLLVVRGGGDTITQILTTYNTNITYVRSGNPTNVGGTGTYSAWAKIWTDANAGPGSGLDADSVDSYHAADMVIPIQTTAGTSTAYTATFTPAFAKVNGRTVRIQVHTDSGSSPTLNANATGAAPIKKANGTAATLKSGGIYTLTYSTAAGAFILQGEGGEYGTAAAAQVLTGYTIGTDNGLVNGSMPNRGAVSITPGTTAQTIASGYHNGSGTVAGDANLIPANIVAGKSIFGVAGSAIVGRPVATGTAISENTSATSKHVVVTGIPFVPKIIIVEAPGGGSLVQRMVYYADTGDGRLNTVQYEYRDVSYGEAGFTVTSNGFDAFMYNIAPAAPCPWIAIG
ncbi:pyocin knob domain-containing protein [Cohnella thailandensis]|uniref:Minor tail protein n=1 Tax=Cohnella thailandensis TaxID=557557 RepID=A0A841SPL1_9BACL|nr:pyocin knob domain-containing protein [Cohnella thailandensis]MBB6632749.1 hypothetical protein [Cohnella thailandensis]MBP1975562.1 hypothetical protein [Cohnella thailandensis]